MASGSQRARTVLALALVVGFYALALGLAAASIYLTYALWHGRSADLRGFGLLVLSWVILRALFPDRGPREAPGPRLDETGQPRLFALIREVAQATGQPLPAEIYLTSEVNAWVTQRGGVLPGLGGKRTMGLGLPLLQALSVTQVKGVIAHEFGHYHAGDAALGPWIYATRQAIGRVITTIGYWPVQVVFRAYGELFLRATQAISRSQELAADRLAARVAGVGAVVEGLRRSHGADLAFGAYWSGELAPVLSAGFLPPWAEGFGRFLTAEAISRKVAEGVALELARPEKSAYDSHPPLHERLGAFGTVPAEVFADDPLAIALLEDVPSLERRLLSRLARAEVVGSLRPLAWDDVAGEVYLPLWKKNVAEHAALLTGLTVAGLPDTVTRADALTAGLAFDVDATSEMRRAGAEWLVGAALATTLEIQGWTVHAEPGPPVWCEREGRCVEPFTIVEDLWDGRLPASEWTAFRERHGIDDAALVDLARAGAWSRLPVVERTDLRPPEPPRPWLTAANLVPAGIVATTAAAIFLTGEPWVPRVERQAKRLQRACDQGSSVDCYTLGLRYERGRGIPQDLGAAARLYERACGGGERAACQSLALLYENGQGVRQNLARAITLLGAACDGGLAAGCESLAGVYEDCRVTARDEARAAALRAKACALGSRASCAARPAAADVRPAHALRSACETGDGDSCAALGLRYQCGVGVSRDPALAAPLFRRGCEAGGAESCTLARRFGAAH
jgi:Zn-dependent protease with chaperone function